MGIVVIQTAAFSFWRQPHRPARSSNRVPPLEPFIALARPTAEVDFRPCRELRWVVSQKTRDGAVMIFMHNMLARTATTGATLLLIGGLTMPSNAFFAAFPQEAPPDSRSVVKPSSDRSNALRPAWPRAPAAARIKPPTTTASADKTLAAKAGKGSLQIIISLDKQQLTLYAGGEAIAHSRVSSGQPGRATPTGVFSVIQKDRWHRSNLYDDAPMYFMQRHHVVRRGTASGRRSELSGLARLRSAARGIRPAIVGHHQARRPRDHSARRRGAGRYITSEAVRPEGARPGDVAGAVAQGRPAGLDLRGALQ